MKRVVEEWDEPVVLSFSRTEWNSFYVGKTVGEIRHNGTGWEIRFDSGKPLWVADHIGEALYGAASGQPAEFMRHMLRPVVAALDGDGLVKVK